MNTKLDFINGNTKKCLLAMTLHMIVAMFLNMAYNLVDSLWIGNLLGELAYAALTNSTPIVLLLTSVAMGATNGISILLSQAIGARNEQKKKKVISTSFYCSNFFFVHYFYFGIVFACYISSIKYASGNNEHGKRLFINLHFRLHSCISLLIFYSGSS